jgi:acetyltransferase-like isoleucine patch superfamily enzyme
MVVNVPPVPSWTRNAEIGRFTCFMPDLSLRTWLPGEKIVIGKFCSIADRVIICTGGHHRTDLAALFTFDVDRTYRGTPNTTIANDVWIGSGALIMGGVSIGDGAVIAAGSVVVADVEPFAIVAGNPATLLRYRFSADIVSRLRRIAWWNWPDAEIFGNVDWFYRPVEEFVEHFDPQGEGVVGQEAATDG